MPGLRRAAGTLARGYDGDTADLDAEIPDNGPAWPRSSLLRSSPPTRVWHPGWEAVPTKCSTPPSPYSSSWVCARVKFSALAWEQVGFDTSGLYVGEQLHRVGHRLIRREVLKLSHRKPARRVVTRLRIALVGDLHLALVTPVKNAPIDTGGDYVGERLPTGQAEPRSPPRRSTVADWTCDPGRTRIRCSGTQTTTTTPEW